jgi:hypothetical protein
MKLTEFCKILLTLTQERLAHLESKESRDFSIIHAAEVNKKWQTWANKQITEFENPPEKA